MTTLAPKPFSMTGNDILDIAKQALVGSLVEATKAEREEFVRWANSIAPVVTIYATLAAQGDPKAKEIMGHIRGQAEANLWILALDEQAATMRPLSMNVALTVANILGGLLTSFVTKGGLLLLGI